jgi:hypothetical protein
MRRLLASLTPEVTTQDDGPCLDWYHESVHGHDRLLITVGDSWTWGDSLGAVDSENLLDDREYRTTHIYGHGVAQTLGADFLMLANPGCSNVWMHDQLCAALAELDGSYA